MSPAARKNPTTRPEEPRIGLHSLGRPRARARTASASAAGTAPATARPPAAATRATARARAPRTARASRAARTRSTCGCASCAARTRRCRCRSSRSGRTRSPSTSTTSRRASTRAPRSTSTRCGRRPGHAQGHPGQGARPRRADQAADRARPRVLEVRPRADRGRGRHLSDHRVVSQGERRRARHDPQLLQGPGDPQEAAFTAAMLALYRLGSFIPVPGVNTAAVKQIEDNYAGSNILGLLNLFTGGGLSRLALFALGIMPYITASIILQLLTVVSPSLEKLSKEGEVGQAQDHAVHALPDRRPRRRAGRRLRLPLPLAGQQRGRAAVRQLLARRRVILIVRLPDRGLRAADVDGRADHPARHRQRHLADDLRLDRLAAAQGVQAWWTNPDQVFKVIMPFLALGVIAAIVFVQEGQRRIPVQYAKRVIGRRMSGGGQTYLPLRVNMAGVIPVIFAASIMAFPPTVGELSRAPRASRRSSARTAGPTSSARPSSSSSSRTSTPRSRSTRSTRRTT